MGMMKCGTPQGGIPDRVCVKRASGTAAMQPASALSTEHSPDEIPEPAETLPLIRTGSVGHGRRTALCAVTQG